MTVPYAQPWVNNVRQAVERLKQGSSFYYDRISETAFRNADERQRKILLLTHFEKLVVRSGVDLKHNLLCPYHDDQQPSMTYYPDTKKFYCHARCFEAEITAKDGAKKHGVHKDAFDLVGDLFEFKGYDDKYNALVSLFVENPQQFFQSRQQSYRKPPGKEKNSGATVHKPARRISATKDSEVKEYLNGRGIDDNMIQLFKIGASEQEGIKLATIPCDHGFEVRRNIRFKPKVDGDTVGKYLNPKGHSVDLFNGRNLTLATADMPVIVVESALDAMIILSVGLSAVAINGHNTIKLVNECKRVANTKKGLRLILLFDFDDAGKRATKRAFEQLQGVVQVVAVDQSIALLATFLANFKDVGEAYQSDKQETEKALHWLVKMVPVD